MKRFLYLLLPCFFVFAFGTDASGASVVVRMMNRGPAVKKEVVSLRERRFVKVIPQSEEYSCGAASLATLLTYHFGRDLSEKDAIQGMIEVSGEDLVARKSFSLLDVKRFAESLGYKGGGYRLKRRHLSKLNIPVITNVIIRGYSHFVVLKEIQDGEVFIADPAWGNRVMDLDEFLKAWSGIVLALSGPKLNDNDGLVSLERKGLSTDYVLRATGADRGLFTLDPSLASAVYIRMN